MSKPKFIASVSVVVVLVFAFFVFKGFALSDEDVARSAISQAEEGVASAYEAVLEAEQAGANVSGLLAQLNDAGKFLAKAQVAFNLDEFDEAVLSASYCSDISEDVKNGAVELWVYAYGSMVSDSWLTVTGSLVAVVVVVFGSFLGWSALKNRYYRRVLRMKPEVAKNES